VSERTIKTDIEDMRTDPGLGWEAPIVYDRGDGRYHYNQKDFSIDRFTLKEEEVQSLIYASMILEQFRKVRILEKVGGAVQKIAEHLKFQRAVKTHDLADYVDFEKVSEMPGIEFLDPLLDAILNNKVVRLTYQAFEKSRPYTHTFHPYLLKEYRNRWYIFGYNEYWNGLRIYGLDRVKDVEHDSSKAFRKPEIPPKDYFRNIIGVTRFEGTEPEKIRLKFTKHQANYILTQPWHESQKVEDQTKDHTIISLNVHPSPELEILILGLHSEVEVLEPIELRRKIFQMHAQSVESSREKPIVYFDMDGILVDFQSGVDQLSEKVKKEYEECPDEVPGIFSLMKPIPEGIEAFKRISKNYECFVLTTAPWKNPTAPSDKREWLKFHLGESVHKRLVISHRKDLNCGSFLIDDNPNNGASDFRGKWIHFGSNEFPDWAAVYDFLKIPI